MVIQRGHYFKAYSAPLGQLRKGGAACHHQPSGAVQVSVRKWRGSARLPPAQRHTGRVPISFTRPRVMKRTATIRTQRTHSPGAADACALAAINIPYRGVNDANGRHDDSGQPFFCLHRCIRGGPPLSARQRSVAPVVLPCAGAVVVPSCSCSRGIRPLCLFQSTRVFVARTANACSSE